MAAVILFLVPLFHGLVFSGLAFWYKKSQRPDPARGGKLALVFSGGGALANLILCIMLIELLSGLSVIAGQEEVSLGAHMPAMLATQPFFIAIVYFVAQGFLRAPNP